MERYELGRYVHLEHRVFREALSGPLRHSVVNDAAGFFISVRFEADAVGGLPWHPHLLRHCGALDDAHHEVVVDDPSAFEPEVGRLFEGERSCEGNAVPIVKGLLEDLPLGSFCSGVALHHDALRVVFEQQAFWLIRKGAAQGSQLAIVPHLITN